MSDGVVRAEPEDRAVDARGRRSRRVVRWAIGLPLLMLLGVVGALLAIILDDAPPPDDADLLPFPQEALPDSENLHVALFALLERLRKFPDVIWNRLGNYAEPFGPHPLDRTIWADPEWSASLESALEEHADLIAALDWALELPRCRPPFHDPIRNPPDATPYKQAVRLLKHRALQARLAGDADGEALLHLRIIELGEKLAKDRGPLLGLFMGVQLSGVGWSGLESMLHDRTPDALTCERIIAYESPAVHGPEAMIEALRWEYRIMRDFADALARRDVEGMDEAPRWAMWLFDPMATRARFAESVRRAQRMVLLPPADRGAAEAAEYRSLQALIRGDFIAGPLCTMFEEGTVLALHRVDRARLHQGAVRCLFALRCYELRYSRLPADLDRLVVEFPFLRQTPIDPWSGAHLRYDPARRILWSVGEDGVDGNGDGWEELRDDPEAERFELPDWVWPIAPVPGG